MNPIVRVYIILFAVFSALLSIGCILFLSQISVMYPILTGVICVAAIYYFTKPNRRYSLPMLWSVFFIFGYVLSFVSVLLDPEAAGVGARNDPTLFVFSNSSYFSVFLVMLAGMMGIACAAVTFEKIFHCNRGLSVAKNQINPNSHHPLRMTSLFWLLASSLAVIGVMWVLGIGRTGLPPATTLPFKLTGILVYIKNMVIPFLGFVVFASSERTGSYRRIRQVFWILLIIGAAGSVAFVSRGFFISMVLPALAYMICYVKNRRISSRFFRESGLLVIGLLLVLIPVIELFRAALYSGISLTAISGKEISETMSVPGAFRKVLSLMTTRIVGFRELVFIIDYGDFDFFGPWRVFSNDDAYIELLSFNLYGFQQDASGDTAFGYALGLWGMLYLSGSYSFVFLGSAVSAAIVLAFEELFLRRGYEQVSLFMAINIGIWVWGGIDWFLLSRLLISSLFCYFLLINTRLSKYLR